MSRRITPIRKVKEGARGTYYEATVACGKMKLLIAMGEDDYPARVTAQYTSGGCNAMLETVQRLITLALECNIRIDCLIEQLYKVVCPACKSALLKGDKTVALSCGKAIAAALERSITTENGEKKE